MVVLKTAFFLVSLILVVPFGILYQIGMIVRTALFSPVYEAIRLMAGINPAHNGLLLESAGGTWRFIIVSAMVTFGDDNQDGGSDKFSFIANIGYVIVGFVTIISAILFSKLNQNFFDIFYNNPMLTLIILFSFVPIYFAMVAFHAMVLLPIAVAGCIIFVVLGMIEIATTTLGRVLGSKSKVSRSNFIFGLNLITRYFSHIAFIAYQDNSYKPRDGASTGLLRIGICIIIILSIIFIYFYAGDMNMKLDEFFGQVVLLFRNFKL